MKPFLVRRPSLGPFASAAVLVAAVLTTLGLGLHAAKSEPLPVSSADTTTDAIALECPKGEYRSYGVYEFGDIEYIKAQPVVSETAHDAFEFWLHNDGRSFSEVGYEERPTNTGQVRFEVRSSGKLDLVATVAHLSNDGWAVASVALCDRATERATS